jgi:hypothetical protein
MSMVMDELGWPYLTYVGFRFDNIFKIKWRIWDSTSDVLRWLVFDDWDELTMVDMIQMIYTWVSLLNGLAELVYKKVFLNWIYAISTRETRL